MRSTFSIRRMACIALAAFAFAQGAVAAMGCTMLRAQGDVAVMPSGEPCEMMGDRPAQVTLKTFAPDASTPQAGIEQTLLKVPALPVLTFKLLDPDCAVNSFFTGLPPPPESPPYLLTLRLRV